MSTKDFAHNAEAEKAGRLAARMRPSPGDLLDPAVPPDVSMDAFQRDYFRGLAAEIGVMADMAEGRIVQEFRNRNK